MGVDYGTYDGEPSLDSGGFVDETNEAWLILDGEHGGEEVDLQAVDDSPGRVRTHTPGEDGQIQYIDKTFEEFHLARLAFGLWERCGPFTEPEGNAIPIEVATAGQAPIAAYLRLGNGFPNPRSYVADKMDVTEQTVSNYCNRVRWEP